MEVESEYTVAPLGVSVMSGVCNVTAGWCGLGVGDIVDPCICLTVITNIGNVCGITNIQS